MPAAGHHGLNMVGAPIDQRSAQVVLAPASGRQLRTEDYVAARSAEFAPDPAAAQAATRAFAERGFTVGPLVGNSFAITGPSVLFEQVFGSEPQMTTAPGGAELSLDRLDERLRRVVRAVVVPQAPEWMT